MPPSPDSERPSLRVHRDLRSLAERATPPLTFPAPELHAEGLEAGFFEGLPFRGCDTRVFYWRGVPAQARAERAPAMVLVHGGGGTAFEAWVRLWTGRGYAAIAMDLNGCVPRGTMDAWEAHPSGGPLGCSSPGKDGLDQLTWPLEDQWGYHAVGAVILAHALLRADPRVDPARIGLTGISWGATLACITAAIDPRFRLVAPVYGCGFMFSPSSWFRADLDALGDAALAERWASTWDPSNYLPEVRIPTLWVTGTNDYYPLDALWRSAAITPARQQAAVRIRMPHAHEGPGENPPEIKAFTDQLLRGGEPLSAIRTQEQHGRTVRARFEGPRRIVRAELCITRDGAPDDWRDKHWEAHPARVDVRPSEAAADLPEGTAFCFMNLFDDEGHVVSAPVMPAHPTGAP
ncbi:alpha/beta hydrolase family protein [Chondromyces apiculatus]|uniref:Prolyl oligopeptidase family protein n=1 Tax=Chondromyces apiculatus DSM 436 TaxID=1192034 RepID=A0A017TDT6_9BACT|nr:acetylxylan esterase [Chondromyces apiculatus]EYF06781.1 prolyl oligopeptidase family protein [Chondromyces apiculatus DSM 436]